MPSAYPPSAVPMRTRFPLSTAAAHAKTLTVFGHDKRHVHRIPERPAYEADTGPAAVVPPGDGPETGTRDALVRQPRHEEEGTGRSERIAAAGHVVPADDATEWVEVQPGDLA